MAALLGYVLRWIAVPLAAGGLAFGGLFVLLVLSDLLARFPFIDTFWIGLFSLVITGLAALGAAAAAPSHKNIAASVAIALAVLYQIWGFTEDPMWGLSWLVQGVAGSSAAAVLYAWLSRKAARRRATT